MPVGATQSGPGSHMPPTIREHGLQWLQRTAALAAILAFAAPALAGNLVWNASADESVAGYYLYYGKASGDYIGKIDVGDQTIRAIPGTVDGQVYYFAATAYNTARIESTFSNEVAVATPLLPQIDVVEFYNAALDHYFITASASDIDALDGGLISGWARTGHSFRAYASPAVELNPVCRFYIPPEHGSSHFFSPWNSDCAFLIMAAANPANYPNFSGYIEEDASAFFIRVPDPAGVCPGASVPVYRLWNQRFDSNHRYTTDPAVKAQMIALGYIAEGFGPDAVSRPIAASFICCASVWARPRSSR